MDSFFHYINDVIFYTFSDSEHARIQAKRNAAVQIVVATAAFILLMRVFPMGVVKNHTLSKQQAYKKTTETAFSGDSFTAEDKKLQMLFFSETHIEQITLYMQCVISSEQSGQESVLFRLYDENFSCIYEEEENSRTIEKNGYLNAEPDMDVETGKAYYYEIVISDESRAGYTLPVADRKLLAQEENSTLYIDGIINEELSLVADFDYTRPLSAVQIVLLYALILAGAVFLYFFLLIAVYWYDGQMAYYSGQISRYFRFGMSAAGGLAVIALFVYAVVLGHFGGEVWDKLFFSIGMIAAWGWLAGMLWRGTRIIRPAQQSKLPVSSKICLVWRNYIQTVCFGLLFCALCQYVNADRDFYHYTNTRWMLIFLAAALLMNYSEKQFVNKFSAIWLALGLVGSVFYCKTAGTDENKLLLARLTCGVVAAWGLLALNILFVLVRTSAVYDQKLLHNIGKKISRQVSAHKQQTVYLVLWGVFSLLMYANRYEKVWVFTATLPFLAFLFAPDTLLVRCRFLRNFNNGILLSFALVTMFCLEHRPHHYWMLYRYGGMFHTVACTGMYLAVVLGAVLAKLYGKLKTRKNILVFCLPEYFVTACVVGFIVLTMSRTAFLTSAVTVAVLVVLTAVIYHKSFRRIVSELGVLAMVCLVSFPMVFTAVRMVPAVVNEPVRYDLEFQDRSFMVYEGDPIDSDKYMTVSRFFSTLFGRFRSEGEEEADAGQIERIWLEETGELVYTGDGLAGINRSQFSMEGDGESSLEDGEKNDISNGRFAIFGDYIKEIGFQGHPWMGPEDKNGNEYAHAHNSFIQVAYNFGVIAGIAFIILYALTLWRSVQFALDHGKKYNIVLTPFVLVVVFGFVSLTEWAYHPCIPVGFSFILMQMVLMRTSTQGR
ncbi:MAG: O-antigen ligase family protein [Lachnospiraceae bacterium]|nr:O-antigen ligase family protein [Lachnospiraceae bacterium]